MFTQKVWHRHPVVVSETMWFHEVEDLSNFDWVLSPTLGWLRLIGVDLNSHGSLPMQRRIYQIFLFACHVCLHLSFFFYLSRSKDKESVWITGEQQTITFLTTFFVYMTNMSLNAVVTHTLLLFHVAERWKHLRFTLGATKYNIDPDFTVKCRRISLIGVVYVIIVPVECILFPHI